MNTEEKDRVEAVTKALVGVRPGTTFTLKLDGKTPTWATLDNYGISINNSGKKMVVKSLNWERYSTRCWECDFLDKSGSYSVPEQYMEDIEL